jgi:hypothetical protein
MSETKWTPGPWVVDRNPDGRIGTHIRASAPTVKGAIKGVSVARITVGGGVADDDKGNAALIAAAPDLYEALKALDALYAHAWDLVEPSGAVVFNPGTVATFEKLHEAASAALDRARGETP